MSKKKDEKKKLYKMSDEPMTSSQKDEVKSLKADRIDRGRKVFEKMQKDKRAPAQIKDDILKQYGAYKTKKEYKKSKAELKKDAERWADMKLDERKLRARRKALESK